MAQQARNPISWIAVLPSLVVPVCLGLTFFVGMLAAIRQGWLENETALRYLTGHPVSQISTAMFFIGIASLLLIAFNVFAQFSSERQLRFLPLAEDNDPTQSEMDDAERAVLLGQQLLDHPPSIHSHYLWQRLTNSLLYVYRNGSSAGVDEEVKYLAELDLDRQQQRYSLVRILIWATPMLGFLGTVLGISQALGGISVGPENDFQAMMDGLQSSLYVAFDTTALALSLSMVMMFAQFLVDRFETQLLAIVDHRARSEIAAQYDTSGTGTAGDSVEQLGHHLLAATKEMMVAQTDIWKKTIRSAEQAWASSLSETNKRVQLSWTNSVENSISRLTDSLTGTISTADQSMVRRWEQWQVLLSDNARMMCQHQQELTAQTESLQSLLNESGSELPLQDAMQRTQDAIAATSNLQAAIDGLSSELKQLSLPTELTNATDSSVSKQPLSQNSDEQSPKSAAPPTANAAANRMAELTRRTTPSANAAIDPHQQDVIFSIAPYLSGKKSIRRAGLKPTSSKSAPRKAA